MDRQPFDRPDHAEHELKGDERVAHKTGAASRTRLERQHKKWKARPPKSARDGWLGCESPEHPLIRGALSVRYRRDAETILLQMETSYRNIINIL